MKTGQRRNAGALSAAVAAMMLVAALPGCSGSEAVKPATNQPPLASNFLQTVPARVGIPALPGPVVAAARVAPQGLGLLKVSPENGPNRLLGSNLDSRIARSPL